MRIGHLTESLEDYLEIMYRLLQTQRVVRVRDIAREKQVKTSSVISALRRLDKEGLVDYKAREYVDLTPEGRDLAFRVYQRHTFLKRFLMDFLQVDPVTAEADACSMEHAISVTTLERIASMSEFLSYCPEVDRDIIDTFRDRWIAHLNDHDCGCGVKEKGYCGRRTPQEAEGVRLLSRLEVGEGGVVARIIAEDTMRQPLIQRGLLPGASIHLTARDEDGVTIVRVAGETMRLDPRQAETVLVWARESWTNGDGQHHEPSVSRTLADVTIGRRFRVRRVNAQGEIRQRMTEMGFIRGAEGRILREALLRDPLEIELGGSRLSLRRVEASGVVVEELGA